VVAKLVQLIILGGGDVDTRVAEFLTENGDHYSPDNIL